MKIEYKKERKEVAYFMRRLYDKNLTTTSGGNISCITEDGTVLITPSQLDKGRMKKEQIAILKIDGTNLTPDYKPTIETDLHLAIYRKRKDVKAIVHAHPVVASAFTALKKKVTTKLTAEAWAIIGEPVFAPYAMMGTNDLAEIVSEASLKGNVISMENHGILAVGTSLLQAFDRMEVMEAAAKMSFLTQVLSDYNELSEDKLKVIDKFME